MKTVAECSSMDEALVLQSLLADSGIGSFVPEALSVSFPPRPGGVHVQVDEDDLEEAIKILSDARP